MRRPGGRRSLRRGVALASAAFALAIASSSAALDRQGLIDAGACTGHDDPAICILRVLARDDAGLRLFDDDELFAHPQVLRAAGVDPDAVLAWADSEAAQSWRAFSAADFLAHQAARAAILTARSGKAADGPLKVVEPAPTASPRLPAFWGQPVPVSPRMLAFQKIVDAREGPEPLRPPDVLVRAALAAWERDLAAAGGVSHERTDAATLAQAYRSVGDQEGALRAIGLDPRKTPAARIELLLKIGRPEDAAKVSETADLALAEADARRRLLQQRGDQQQGVDLILERVSELMADRDGKLAKQTGRKLSKRQRQEILRESAEGLQPQAVTDAEVKLLARNELTSARALLVSALARTRPDLARRAADAALSAGAPACGADEEDTAVSNTADLVAAASPAVARAWLTRLERAPLPHPSRESVSLTAAASVFPACGLAAAAGWRALGDAARADMIARRLPSPPARPESPEETMSRDIREGRGLARLDELLARATPPHNPLFVLISCRSESLRKEALDDARTCVMKAVPLTDAERKPSLADEALRVAERAAKLDRPDLALEMTAVAGRLAAEAAPSDRFGPSSFDTFALLATAKAVLRREGRI